MVKVDIHVGMSLLAIKRLCESKTSVMIARLLNVALMACLTCPHARGTQIYSRMQIYD